MRSSGLLDVLASIVACVLFIHWWRKTTYGKNTVDRLLVRVPFIGSIIVGRFTASFLQSLSLLLNSGMPLVPALEVARVSIRNSQLRKYVDQIKHAVEQGSSLHDAMMITAPTVFGPQVRAIVTIGQESGQLPHMLTLVAKIEQKAVMRQLRILTLLVQPLLMLLLGLLVALLIVAVYGPIINLSHAVSL